MSAWILPCAVCGILLFGLWKGVDVYDALICGVREGLRVCLSVFPALLTMLTVVSMVQASGLTVLLTRLLSPLTALPGIPADCLPLALLRPFSGSGALSLGSAILEEAGTDSLTGRVAAVMLGSSETTFYVIAVYASHLGLRDTGYTLKAALIADLAAFLLSGIAVRLLMG